MLSDRRSHRKRSKMRFESIYIAGHRGLVGSAVLRNLRKNGYDGILVRTRQQLDLRSQDDVRKFFFTARPRAVIVAAAKAGGIRANSEYPVEFLIDNLRIQNNLISASFESGVKKNCCFLGVPVFIRSLLLSRFRRNLSSQDLWNRPTNPMRSQRSLG